jgi:hypothetical protein
VVFAAKDTGVLMLGLHGAAGGTWMYGVDGAATDASEKATLVTEFNGLKLAKTGLASVDAKAKCKVTFDATADVGLSGTTAVLKITAFSAEKVATATTSAADTKMVPNCINALNTYLGYNLTYSLSQDAPKDQSITLMKAF